MTNAADARCKPNAHDFLPKRQATLTVESNQHIDVSELYCRKCGTVCFLTGRESESTIKIARPS